MKNIKIYTSQTCYWCQAAKEFFKKNKVRYREINVENNLIAMVDMIRKSKQFGVPVVDIDGQIIVGFNQKKIEQALKN